MVDSRTGADPAWFRFARDVAVNVLANLVAAVILYLLGVVFEVLPGTRGSIVASAFFLLYVGALGLTALANRRQGSMRDFTVVVSAVCMGSAAAVSSVGAPTKGERILDLIVALGCGLAAGLAAIGWYLRRR